VSVFVRRIVAEGTGAPSAVFTVPEVVEAEAALPDEL
jgi:hypothetical protein